MVFKTDNCFVLIKNIAECSKGSILQYFGPSFSYNLSLRYLFYLFLSGRLRHVLLYFYVSLYIVDLTLLNSLNEWGKRDRMRGCRAFNLLFHIEFK